MIHPTPKLSEAVLKHLDSDNFRDRPILRNYPGFTDCFVWLHPFLLITEVDPGRGGSKPDWYQDKHSEEARSSVIYWAEILEKTGIPDLQSLDRAVGFYHRAYRYAERSAFLKLHRLLITDRPDIAPPQVDQIPHSQENTILSALLQYGYSSVDVYTQFDERRERWKTTDLITNYFGTPSFARIETPDSKLLIDQDFDQRFTYLLGPKHTLLHIVDSTGLEGFFCDEQTPESWSWIDIPEAERMDANESMRL